MKIVFTDTNKLFGLFRAMILHNSNFSWSVFVEYIKNNTVYISTFVLSELSNISIRKWLSISDSDIKTFVEKTWLRVYESSFVGVEEYHKYVLDKEDAQIVQDAVEIEATHILTNNLKDFHKEYIFSKFNISIVSELEEII